MAQPAYMTLPEAAAYLRVPTEQIRAALHSGACRGAKVGKRWVVRARDLDAYYDRLVAGESAWASTGATGAATGTSASVGTSTAAAERLFALKP